MPVESRDHDQHRDQREAGRDEWHEAIDREILDRLRVVLNPVGRVGAAPRVVIGQRQALNVREEPRAKAQQELLPRIGLQHPRSANALQLVQQCDPEQQDDGNGQRPVRDPRRGRQHAGQPGGQRPRPDHAVDDDLQRQWRQQRQRRRRAG